MEPRIQYNKYSLDALKAMLALERHLSASGLGEQLLNLVKLRASQINGCAYCIDMHWKDARAVGETEQRLYGLDAWRESPYYTSRERAALDLTEAITLVAQTHVPDEVFEAAKKEFSEQELVDLTYAVAAINSWNRLAISMRAVPGPYQPQQKKATVA
ncbi:MAG TPA: carboxymuconolactone decarboxylase family protein [Candidatus Acidoferrum sp.]|nr:carboxymuconolactone decarboxylase family protein [Candidatus Acidoferrum sp.]